MISAVIGSGFGDEGKGVCVDHLATPDTLVVRFCGGAQAGHSVVTPQGRRHVFHQFGSGTLRGADTLLSRFMMVNPILFVAESRQLNLPGHKVYVDPRARVTTPFDMWINRAAETCRGDARHGSCGLGIHETVLRSQSLDATLTVNDLIHPGLPAKLHYIQSEYLPKRCEELGVEVPVLAQSDRAISRFVEDILAFLSGITLVNDTEALSEWPHIIFEGSQGLRLDEFYGEFPYVTHARTGLTNIEILLRTIGVEPIQVYYVTRCYTTRHGAGPLMGEVTGHPFGWVGDETNVTNDYQGAFRYAPLDIAAMSCAIQQDLLATRLPIHKRLALTCTDQMPAEAALALQRTLDNIIPVGLVSRGPTRSHVQSYDYIQ